MELNTKIVNAAYVCLIEYKCLCCNKNYRKKFDEILKKRFAITYKFSNYKISNFIPLLWKSVYPFEYMDDWEKFDEQYYQRKKIFTVTEEWNIIMQISRTQEEFVRILKKKFR